MELPSRVTTKYVYEQLAPVYPVALTLVLLSGVFLRLHFMTGPVASDDTRYLEFARKFLSLSRFTEVDPAAGRLLFLGLIGWPVKVFGHAVYAALANIAYASLVDLLVVWFCLREFGKHTALCAALIMVANPITISFSGMILPDPTLALFLLLSAFALHFGSHQEVRAQRYLWIAASGLLACLAYLCKDPGVLMLPVAVVVLFFFPAEATWQERFLGPLLFVAAFAALFAVDGFVYLAYTGDFFYKRHATTLRLNLGIAALGPVEFLQQTSGVFLSCLEQWKDHLVPLWLGIPAMALALGFCPQQKVFAGLGLFVLFFLFFGTSSLTGLLPLPVQLRYLHPVLPFVAICAASLFHKAWFLYRPWVKTLFPLALGLGLGLAAADSVSAKAGIYDHAPFLKSVRTALETLQDEIKPIYVDRQIRSHLPHFVPDGLLARVRVIPDRGELPGGYYLFDPGGPSLPKERMAEISALKVKMRLELDWRVSNQFRDRRYRARPPALLVFEKEDPRDFIPFPDLVVQSLECRREGGTAPCTLIVRNQSPYPAAAFGVRVSREPSFSGPLESLTSEPIPGWSRASVQFSPPGGFVEGGDLHVWLDPDNAVLERDKTNNRFTRKGHA